MEDMFDLKTISRFAFNRRDTPVKGQPRPEPGQCSRDSCPSNAEHFPRIRLQDKTYVRSGKVETETILAVGVDMNPSERLEPQITAYMDGVVNPGDACPDCGAHVEQSALKGIQHAPEVLFVQLKIYTVVYNQRAKRQETFKSKKHTVLSEELDLTVHAQGSGTEIRYRLSSVLAHEGPSTDRGHYVTFAPIEGQWYMFNDQVVLPTSLEAVQAEVDDFKPYILTYVKV